MEQLPLDLGVLKVRLLGGHLVKINNYRNVRMCVHEFFNPILQIEGSLHEEIRPKGRDERLELTAQFLHLK